MFILEEVILQARVPIIKFKRTDNDLTGDIAVANMLALANTRLIKTYTLVDERVLQLGDSIGLPYRNPSLSRDWFPTQNSPYLSLGP